MNVSLAAAAGELYRSTTGDDERTVKMDPTAQIIVAFVFGLAFVIILIMLAVKFPEPTPFQYSVFRAVLALAAAGVGAMIPGFLDVNLDPSS